jgi:DNA-binding LacI/PurR family transcriptional regulator
MDSMTAGALTTPRHAGPGVRTTPAVIGLDDSRVAADTGPQHTSVHDRVEEMGAKPHAPALPAALAEIVRPRRSGDVPAPPVTSRSAQDRRFGR